MTRHRPQDRDLGCDHLRRLEAGIDGDEPVGAGRVRELTELLLDERLWEHEVGVAEESCLVRGPEPDRPPR